MTKAVKKQRVKELPKTEEPKFPTVFFYTEKHLARKLFEGDLEKIKKMFGVEISEEKGKFTIISNLDISWCRKACVVLEKIFNILDKNVDPTDEEVDEFILEMLPKPYKESKYKGFFRTYKNEEISPRTENQELALDMMKKKVVSIIHGKAGTGKSKLCLMYALNELNSGRYEKILIIRPMTVVGNSIGYLPGDLNQKIFNYYGPIHSSLVDLIGEKELETKIKEKKIIFESISFIRGGNFDDALVIVDEVQNTTKMEILTICTRLGQTSKLIITGDTAQFDLKTKEKNGLECLIEKLTDIEDVGFVKMTEKDIQRHKLVGEIIRAFE